MDVIYDDRPKVSPGVKFKDAELIGVPTIVTVGRGLADGVVEVKDRRSGERTDVPVAEAADAPGGGGREGRSVVTDLEAVIFDWGGTLTQWHDIDFHEESLALAQAVRTAGDDDHPVNAERLHRAGETIWGWSRDHQRSATIDDLFTEAGLEHDPELLTAYFEFWEPHTLTDPDVRAHARGAPGRRVSRSASSPTPSGRARGTTASSSGTASSP